MRMLREIETDGSPVREATMPEIDRAGETPEKVLVVHNDYLRAGGEDLVFEEETALLEEHGHEVLRHRVHNEQAVKMNRVRLAGKTLWNRSAYRELRDLIRRERPGVVHFHNTFPLISPAGYHAAAAEGVAVVQTLHNYRLMCPNGLFFRDGSPCEDCTGKIVPWPGAVHGCYRGSRPASTVAATMLSVHRAFGTWTDMVDAYVALTDFARGKFVAAGLPEERILVKPNFVSPDPGAGAGSGGYTLFAGRLSPEKGIGTLLEAWELMGEDAMPLKIAGDGPLAATVRRAAEENPRVEWLGHRSVEGVRRLMKDAAMLILPSEWYETFGRVAVESFAAGTPVVVASTGAIAELVDHGRTGLHFRPGDAVDLARQVKSLKECPTELSLMRLDARAEFERRYTAARNYALLASIYVAAADRAAERAAERKGARE
jgi:glycosyltransferase involved in cell wall biosynthesis